jgi:purine-binding chemotaxis protein CheW
MKQAIGNTSDMDAPAQYLTFLLGGEAFGIGIMAVKEIIEFGSVTDVPMMPAAIRGVINLRGAVVPVMDLAARFGRAPTVPGKRTCIVIVELPAQDGAQVTGIVVDAVSAVLDIAPADVQPAPSFGTRIRGDFIAGMGKVNGKFVILLDVEQVLALEGMPDPADRGAVEALDAA